MIVGAIIAEGDDSPVAVILSSTSGWP